MSTSFGHGFSFFTIILILIQMGDPYWRICRRAGISRVLLALLLVPGGWILFVWIVAFSQWPTPGTALKEPKRGIVYTPGEIEEFKRRGVM